MATVPSPHTWSTGDTVRAEHFNTDIRDSYAFLFNKPVVHVTHTSGLSTGSPSSPSSVVTLDMVWNHADIDTDGMFDANDDDNGARLTAQTAGLYEIILHVDWEIFSASDPSTRYVQLRKYDSGTTTIGVDMTRPCDDDGTLPVVNHLVVTTFLNVGDYVRAFATNTDSTTLDTFPGTDLQYLTFFAARWLAGT